MLCDVCTICVICYASWVMSSRSIVHNVPNVVVSYCMNSQNIHFILYGMSQQMQQSQAQQQHRQQQHPQQVICHQHHHQLQQQHPNNIPFSSLHPTIFVHV